MAETITYDLPTFCEIGEIDSTIVSKTSSLLQTGFVINTTISSKEVNTYLKMFTNGLTGLLKAISNDNTIGHQIAIRADSSIDVWATDIKECLQGFKVNNASYSDISGKTNGINGQIVGNNNIKDGAISSSKLEDSSVDSQKIKDAAITTDKIANYAITSDKIAESAITTYKIANGAITSNKIANGAVVKDKLGYGSVKTSNIVDDAITFDKMITGNVKDVFTATSISTNSYSLTGTSVQYIVFNYCLYFMKLMNNNDVVFSGIVTMKQDDEIPYVFKDTEYKTTSYSDVFLSIMLYTNNHVMYVQFSNSTGKTIPLTGAEFIPLIRLTNA